MKVWIVIAKRRNGPDKRVYLTDPIKRGWVPEGARVITFDAPPIDEWFVIKG